MHFLCTLIPDIYYIRHTCMDVSSVKTPCKVHSHSPVNKLEWLVSNPNKKLNYYNGFVSTINKYPNPQKEKKIDQKVLKKQPKQKVSVQNNILELIGGSH